MRGVAAQQHAVPRYRTSNIKLSSMFIIYTFDTSTDIKLWGISKNYTSYMLELGLVVLDLCKGFMWIRFLTRLQDSITMKLSLFWNWKLKTHAICSFGQIEHLNLPVDIFKFGKGILLRVQNEFRNLSILHLPGSFCLPILCCSLQSTAAGLHWQEYKDMEAISLFFSWSLFSSASP